MHVNWDWKSGPAASSFFLLHSGVCSWRLLVALSLNRESWTPQGSSDLYILSFWSLLLELSLNQESWTPQGSSELEVLSFWSLLLELSLNQESWTPQREFWTLGPEDCLRNFLSCIFWLNISSSSTQLSTFHPAHGCGSCLFVSASPTTLDS